MICLSTSIERLRKATLTLIHINIGTLALEHIKEHKYLNINVQKSNGNLSIKLRTQK